MRRALPLIAAGIVFAALCIVWIASDRRAAERVYDTYSTANTSDSGLSLAAAYLQKSRTGSMLTEPLARAAVEPNAVIFRITSKVPLYLDPEDIDPKQVGPPSPRRPRLLNEDEHEFVMRGGRIVLATEGGALDTMDVDAQEATKVFPIWPRVTSLEHTDRAFLQLPPRMHTIFTAGGRPVVARERIGAGELFVVSMPELFTNENLAGGHHLGLLSALAGEKRPVYFDEVPHAIVTGDGALALMKEWNLGPFLILGALVAALIFWRAGRRVGPPEEDYRETRSDAVDLVRSLAALYRDVTTDAAAIALYHDALTRTVANQTGLRGDALHKRVDDLTGGINAPDSSRKMPARVFQRQLDAINDAFAKSQSRKGGQRGN